jgi:hypothetical protein
MMAAAFLLVIGLLLYVVWHQKNRAFKLRVNDVTSKDAQEEPRMSVSHRASMSLRMSRLDKNDDDVENQNHRDKRDSRRLSAYSNARRKSEIAQEDAVNRDIDAAVKKKKDARKQRKRERREKASMSSGQTRVASTQMPTRVAAAVRCPTFSNL